MMGEVTNCLREAKGLIADERNWIQGNFFKDKQGITCNFKDACSYCALGALYAVNGTPKALCFAEKASRELYNLDLAPLNDLKTHADVMAVLDLAIQYSEEENV